ncbi:kindlin 2 [Paragonimus westermani]|uniref:Kindlin 2 n=1 Tax=Paragonimus westermani TaxID=34504 RepID=A0A5J4NWZ6_9TREM|nr:kindlin 2 [Paragonimus westermani]
MYSKSDLYEFSRTGQAGNGSSSNYNMNGFDTVNRLVVDGNYIDGSWELSVFVEDIAENVKVRVLGSLTLGGLMHRIVEGMNIQQSWSDHGIWWSDRKIWLLHNRTTLDQYGIQSDAKLMFRRMHGNLQVILPSMVPVVLRVNYSSRVFTVVRSICKELNIRHSEELSLSFPITRAHLKANTPLPTLRHGVRRPASPVSHGRSETATLKTKPHAPGFDGTPNSPYGTLHSAAGTMMRLQSENSLDRERLDVAQYADCNFRLSAKTVFTEDWLMKPKNLIHKARLNSGWLDSSRSLMEHGIEPPPVTDSGDSVPTLYLCFKYYAFYDINLKYDAVRIHLLYEQARWSVLSGLLECTEDEMVVFAAYQLQAQLQSSAVRQGISPCPFTDPSNYYPTFGTTNTLTANYMGGSRGSPDLSRRHVPVTAGSYYGMVNAGNSSSLMRLPGAMSPMSGTSMVDGVSHRQPSDEGTFDEVDEMLAELEQSCGVAEEPGSTARALQNASGMFPTGGTLRTAQRGSDVPDTAEIPSLQDSLRVFRERTFMFRRYKVYWVVIREARLLLYRSERETDQPLYSYSLCDCSVTPDVSTATHKYILKLVVLAEPNRPNGIGARSNGSSTPHTNSIPTVCREEIWLRFEAAEQYARWLAACRLGAKGKTLASRVAYEKEVETILEILRLQVPGPTPAISANESVKYLGDLTDFCAERIIRKARSKNYLRQRITEAHVNIRNIPLLDAKHKYIQAWQRLTSFGRSYFTVLFDRGSNLGITSGSNNSGLFSTPMDDVIAICQGRFELVSPQNGDVLRAWNFTDLRSWNVNWDAGKVVLDFRSGTISFRPLCTNCKTIVEFIGGYVFLSQRTPEKSQECNERLFHRLTGATD